MLSSTDSVSVTRILLLFSGTALIAIGFLGIILDLIHSWRIEEYSSFVALFLGSAILLATTVVYVVIPGFQGSQRREILKRYYLGKPKGEIKNINHSIMERSQGLIAGTEILAELSHTCDKDGATYEECHDNVIAAKKMLEQINFEAARLGELIIRLEDNVNLKKSDPKAKH